MAFGGKGTSVGCFGWLKMLPDRPPTDPADTDPEERRKVRGSKASSLGLWIIVLALIVLAALAYAGFAAG